MNEQTTLAMSHTSIFNLKDKTLQAVAALIVSVAGLYSQLLGEEVTPRQTLHLLHAQTSFFVAAFSSCGMATRLILLVWTACALHRCRASFR